MAKVPKVSGSFSFGLFTSGLSLSVGGSKNEIIGSKKLVLKGGGGGNETRSGYLRYVPVIQADVPACTTCRHGLYNSMVS